MSDEPNYPPMPTVADLLANPPTREDFEAAATAATAPPRFYFVAPGIAERLAEEFPEYWERRDENGVVIVRARSDEETARLVNAKGDDQ